MSNRERTNRGKYHEIFNYKGDLFYNLIIKNCRFCTCNFGFKWNRNNIININEKSQILNSFCKCINWYINKYKNSI